MNEMMISFFTIKPNCLLCYLFKGYLTDQLDIEGKEPQATREQEVFRETYFYYLS